MTKHDHGRATPRHGAGVFKHRALRIVAATTAGLLGFGIVYVGFNAQHIQSAFTTQDIGGLLRAPGDSSSASPTPTKPVDETAGQAINILLIGSDVRSGENGAIGGVVGGMRSDTTIIMHISADRSRIDFLSIPRDSRVAVPDCTLFSGKIARGWTGKFNIAFANGGREGDAAAGAACTMKTITTLTGITFPGNHYAVVDFVGFEQMINAVHGVPMCITSDINSNKAKLHLKAGPQVLDGKQALAWARARYGIGDGTDLGRIDRQQELLNNLARKVLGMNMLTNVSEATSFVKSAAQSLTMDPQLGNLKYLLGLGYSLRNISTSNINFMTVPWKYPGDKSGDVVWTPEADIVFKRIIDDLPMDGGTPVAVSPSPSSPAQGAGVTPSSPSDTPVRETQAQILADCKP